jgi:4-hydroxybutyrate CoA-transferase
MDKGKTIATIMMGSQKLYDYADCNPSVELRSVDYVNHPMIIAQQSKMVSVNACLEVDLMGQVVSDSIGLKQYSGVGGQVDFIRGTAASLDGRGISILAMPSVLKKQNGKLISKIKPLLTEGSAVSASRNDIDHIATEYGIVKLKGKTLKERAKLLISIAHPSFRDELTEEFERRFQYG